MIEKKLLVTGGAGFIGSNFIRHALLSKDNWEIVNLDAITYAGNPGNFDDLPDGLKKRYRLIHGNIKDKSLLKRLFDKEKFDVVVHFAAESHVDRSIVGPSTFVETNVFGTFTLLEAALKSWEQNSRPDNFKFLHISTDEVYGSLGSEGYFTEDTPYDPSSPYSASKAASDHFANAFCRTYGLPVVITNCSNNYGPYQFPEKLIPLIILNIMNEKELPVYGDGKNIRDWLFVIDHCEALFRVIDRGIPGEQYNIGGDAEYQNIDIVNLLCDIMDKKLGRSGNSRSRRLIKFVTDRPGHDRRYAIDASKIKQELGWEPQYDFNDAIKDTIDWYMGHLEWVNSVQSGEYRKWIEVNYNNR